MLLSKWISRVPIRINVNGLTRFGREVGLSRERLNSRTNGGEMKSKGGQVQACERTRRGEGRETGTKRRTECCEIERLLVTRLENQEEERPERTEGETKCDARLPSGVSRIICIIRVESFFLGALMGLWDLRFGYTPFSFSLLPSASPPSPRRPSRTSGKEVKIRIRREYSLFCH